MTVLVPDAVIKHDGEFTALKNDLNSIFHRFYRKTLTRSVLDQIIEGVKHIASLAIMSRKVIEQIGEAVRHFFRTWQEPQIIRQ
jgi:hypothetical protein